MAALRVVVDLIILNGTVLRAIKTDAISAVIMDIHILDGNMVRHFDQNTFFGIIIEFTAFNDHIIDPGQVFCAALYHNTGRAIIISNIVLQRKVIGAGNHVEPMAVIAIGNIIFKNTINLEIRYKPVQPVMVGNRITQYHIDRLLMRVKTIARHIFDFHAFQRDIGVLSDHTRNIAVEPAINLSGRIRTVAVQRQVTHGDIAVFFRVGVRQMNHVERAFELAREVCGRPDVRLSDVMSSVRLPYVVRVRHVTWFLLCKGIGWAHHRISVRFNLDPSTAGYGIRKLTKIMADDEALLGRVSDAVDKMKADYRDQNADCPASEAPPAADDGQKGIRGAKSDPTRSTGFSEPRYTEDDVLSATDEVGLEMRRAEAYRVLTSKGERHAIAIMRGFARPTAAQRAAIATLDRLGMPNIEGATYRDRKGVVHVDINPISRSTSTGHAADSADAGEFLSIEDSKKISKKLKEMGVSGRNMRQQISDSARSHLARKSA